MKRAGREVLAGVDFGEAAGSEVDSAEDPWAVAELVAEELVVEELVVEELVVEDWAVEDWAVEDWAVEDWAVDSAVAKTSAADLEALHPVASAVLAWEVEVSMEGEWLELAWVASESVVLGE